MIFMSKFPAGLKDCSLSPNNDLRGQSATWQLEMSLLHREVAVEKKATNYILFCFFLINYSSFLSLQKPKSMEVESVMFAN